MSLRMDRRSFVKCAAGAAVAATLATPKALGANERVRAAFIGVGNRGGQLIAAAQVNSHLEVVALCDVDRAMTAEWAAKLGGHVDQYGDFRSILDRNDIDVVFIATPEHWHAIQTISACEAGKDVYVEKPLALTVREGRRMVSAARRHNRIVQVGLQRRASPIYEELHQLMKSGAIGKVTAGHAYRLSNMWPQGIGKLADAEPPAGLDWDQWLGPRPWRPYRANIAPYKFRWWKDYSSQVGNWGVHYFDFFRWMVDEEAPASVCTLGGTFAVEDDRTIPDTLVTTFEFASGRLFTFAQYEASQHPMQPGEIDFRGTKGIVYASNGRVEIIPEKGGQFQDPAPRMEPKMLRPEKGDNEDLTSAHIGEFLSCVASRDLPRADVEVGHRSTVFAHLANIALETRARLDWDPHAERFTNHDAANAYLDYEYRAPWDAWQRQRASW